MKISKIHIHNFYQFQDFELDLTYPKGHEKEGMPLDKVCIIGQSGTGKTTLLKMISSAAHYSSRFKSLGSKGKLIDFTPFQQVDFTIKSDENELNDFYIQIGANESTELASMNKDLKEPIFRRTFYFPSGLSNLTLEENTDNPFLVVNEDEAEYYKKGSFSFVFDKALLDRLWKSLSAQIFEHQTKAINYKLNLVDNLIKEESGNTKKAADLMKEWEDNNLNPLEKIADECLDKFLNKFHLAVKTKIDDYRQTETLQIYSTLNGLVVPYDKLSTGTRQIIFTSFPLYQLIDDGSLILIDQPEDSLYPDIQKELVPFYTSFDKNKKSQFFFATHSPIIASSFEPWEIVELKFNENGKIFRNEYFKGENHIDNYHIDARYLRWDGILTDIFDMKTEGNEEFRSKMLMEYSILKRKFKKLEEKENFDPTSEEARGIITQLKKAGDLLGSETGNK